MHEEECRSVFEGMWLSVCLNGCWCVWVYLWMRGRACACVCVCEWVCMCVRVVANLPEWNSSRNARISQSQTQKGLRVEAKRFYNLMQQITTRRPHGRGGGRPLNLHVLMRDRSIKIFRSDWPFEGPPAGFRARIFNHSAGLRALSVSESIFFSSVGFKRSATKNFFGKILLKRNGRRMQVSAEMQFRFRESGFEWLSCGFLTRVFFILAITSR